MRLLRLGTRGSALAQAQARWTAGRLSELHPGLEVELVVVETSGDRFSLAPDGPAAGAPNVKAMFVKEIEEGLLSGELDLGVHSAKDLPGALPEGLAVAAYPPREDPRDVWIGRGGTAFEAAPEGARVGTASSRRRLQLQAARAGLSFAPIRGNVDTRLRRLEEGRVDALVLAAAGLKRLGLSPAGARPLSPELVVPAPGQGALALESRLDRAEVRALLAPLDCERTRREVELERALLLAVGGGCSTPLGALARAEGRTLSLSVFWSDPAGTSARRLSGRAERPEELSSLVSGLAERLKA